MQQTLGEQLKNIRQSKEISLEEISNKTRIRLDYLEAVENNDVETLPSPMHMRGFLRLYASELGVEMEELQVGGYHLTEKQPQKSTAPEQPEDTKPEKTETSRPKPTILDEPPDPVPGSVPEETPGTSVIPLTFEAEFPASSDVQPSAETFLSIGQTLKKRRELLSLSIDDIHQQIRIQKQNLEAIEAGRFEQLPSSVQAKGMLTNYAAFLGLDIDALLLTFAEGLQMQHFEKQQTEHKKSTRSARELSSMGLMLKNFFSLDLLIILLLFSGFAIFVIWGVNRILGVDTPETAPTELPGVADILLATESPTDEPIISENNEEPPVEQGNDLDPEGAEEELEEPLIIPTMDFNPINLIIIPRQRTWVQVVSDSEVVFEGRMLPGNPYSYSAQDQVEILTGNVGALQIFFNDQEITDLGLAWQVTSLVFTPSGMVRPTPTITPTPTETPEVTPSPTPTVTETPLPESPDD